MQVLGIICRYQRYKFMHLKRWITALVAVPLLVLLISKGGAFLFAVVISIACVLALWEYFGIVLDKAQRPWTFSFQLSAYIIGPFIIWAAYINAFKVVLGLIILNLIVCALISLPKFKSDSSVSEIVFKQVLGIIYIPLFISCIVMIRNGGSGVWWIYFLVCVVFAGDIGAYYIGTYFGRHKLCPVVSPNKTIEGSVGGLALTLGVGALFKYFFMPLVPWGLSILFFLSIGIAGQVGDLFESALKRAGNIKDSGVLLPGHGGLLDRIDALLFAAPVTYFFKEYFL